MSQVNRTPAGGRIDRAQTLWFEFDGRRLEGCQGDTLASALLANDIHLVARSFKYHRPRGIVTAGGEEPNALVQLGDAAESLPNARATQVELFEGLVARSQNRWPGLAFDLGAVNDVLAPLLPAGFYYKTFMWPGWMRYENAIRRMAGLGSAPAVADLDRYERMHAHCDVLVVGAGPAGLAAALAASRAGARVILADGQSEPGGRLLGERDDIDGRPALAWVAAAAAELRSRAEVELLARTAITGCYDHNFVIGCQRFALGADPRLPRERLWKIRAREIVLATGSGERPLVFPDNDRPGIMLAGAVRAYLNRFGILAGRRLVVATGNDDAYRSAIEMADAGAATTVVDLRAQATGFLPQQARVRGIEVLPGHAVVATRGRARVDGVRVQPLAGGPARDVDCDLVAVSGGWAPVVQLFSQAQGRLSYDARIGAFVPGEAHPALRCAGSVRGAFTLRAALEQGGAAGAQAARACGFDAPAPGAPAVSEPEETAADPHPVRYRARSSARKQFVDFQSDVTVADVELALREGYAGAEHLKRYTTANMGADQGKTGHANLVALLAELQGIEPQQVGMTTLRPPYEPLSFGAIAGADRAGLYDPLRKTPLDAWHASHAAVFEHVGQWRRAWYYPHPGEGLYDAVARECRAARRAVGLLDASTLGKIDVQGPDAAEFLDRIYCNGVRSLAPGRCRYGLMLKQDGMVFDDGVIARLAEDRFVLTTTTSGASAVLAWLEEWLQTEWPQLRAYCTSVTEQYAQVALAGPRAAELLAPLCSARLETMPHMAVREAEVAGIAARVFRVSFTGGPGYEVAVPASRGYELWTTLMGAGERFGIVPYGTEAMHVLRAEAGFIIVGQETDGTVTPLDLGLDRMVARPDFFVGKRSLSRPDARRRDRRQLVGLLTDSPPQVLPEGAQLVAEPRTLGTPGTAPVPMLGHVTSSYYSATCGRSIALGLVEAGISRLGETLYVPLAETCAKVIVAAPRFVGPTGEPLHG